MLKRYRDLTIVDIENDKSLVIACDSTGGIGMKENDTFKVDPEIVGYYSAQVVLTELIAFGAEVLTVVDALCVEMEGYGERILDGIKEAVKSIGLDPELCINGSTEENITTTATGIGITAIGIIDRDKMELNEIELGDVVAIIGKPSVAEEVINEDPKNLMTVEKLKKIKSIIELKEIVPIGSKGLLSELKISSELREYGYIIEKEFKIEDSNSILHKSAGPATAVLAVLSSSEYEKLKESSDIFSLNVGKVI